MFALDTNTLIYYFKGTGNVPQRFLATSPKEVAIPAIVLYEIENGILGSSSPAKRRQTLRELLDVVTVLPFDRRAAEIAAGTKSDLQKKRSGHRSTGSFDRRHSAFPRSNPCHAQH